eukprot:scaffold11571_cov122-Cylindrotheca_fusiformis.AAC.21
MIGSRHIQLVLLSLFFAETTNLSLMTASAFQATPRTLFSRRQTGTGKTNFPSQFSNDYLSPFILKISAGGENGGEDGEEPAELVDKAVKGRGLLCLVALLYGTLNVSLRLVYQLDAPPSAAALSAARGWLASICFLPLFAFRNFRKQDSRPEASNNTVSDTPKSSSRPLLLAGFELAVWNFLAQGLLNVGLLSTGSARASFLTQTSVVMTPIISLFAGQSVAPTVWIGCAVALCGLTLLSGGLAGGSMLAFSTGDLLVMGGALSWSLYLFRLSKIGSKFDEIRLQAMKTNALAVLYSLWLGLSVWQNPGTASWGWITSITAWLALFYSAAAPGTMADILQQQGQKDVSASEGMLSPVARWLLIGLYLNLFSSPFSANVILSMEPVFAALCARLLLGETTSLEESLGGGLILVAALIATR